MCCILSSPDVIYTVHHPSSLRENSPGMHVWKYGNTTGLTQKNGQHTCILFLNLRPYMFRLDVDLTNASEYSITFTEKKSRFLLTNIIKDLFSLTWNCFCHFFGDLTRAIMPCPFQTPLLTYIAARHWFGNKNVLNSVSTWLYNSPLLAVHQ